MEPTAWDYRVATFKNTETARLQRDLTAYGRAGWELVSLSTTVKTMVNVSGNDLIAVFKRPSEKAVDASAEPGTATGTDGWS